MNDDESFLDIVRRGAARGEPADSIVAALRLAGAGPFQAMRALWQSELFDRRSIKSTVLHSPAWSDIRVQADKWVASVEAAALADEEATLLSDGSLIFSLDPDSIEAGPTGD